MKKFTARRKILFTVLTFVLVVLIAVLSIDQKRYAGIIEQELIAAAREANILLSFENARIFFFGLRADAASAATAVGGFPLLLNFTQSKLKLKLAGLFSGKADINFSAEGYQGILDSRFRVNLRGSQGTGSASIRNFQLKLQPQLQSLGIINGQFNLEANPLSFENGRLHQAKLLLDLKEFETSQAISLPAKLTGLPLPLTIPEIKDGLAYCQIDLAANQATIENCKIRTSLGAVTGRAKLLFAESKKNDKVDLILKVALSAKGHKLLKPFLEVSGNLKSFGLNISSDLDQTSKNFHVKLQGSLHAPVISLNKL